MQTRRSLPGVLVLVALFTLPVRSLAQEPPAGAREVPWALIDAVGYGGLGFALGFGVGVPLSEGGIGPSPGAILTMAGGIIAGTVSGAIIGKRASYRLSRGDSLTSAHRSAVVLGSALAGGTLGALAAIPLISGQGSGTPLGSDEQAFAICAGTGIALGALFGVSRSIPVRRHVVSVAPIIVTRKRMLVAIRIQRLQTGGVDLFGELSKSRTR